MSPYLSLAEEMDLRMDRAGRLQFIPPELDDGFTSADFARAAGISRELADVTLNILYFTGNVIRTEKKGRCWLYNIFQDY